MANKIACTFLIASLLFISCKKDRTCSCNVTRTGTSTTESKVEEVILGIPLPLADTSFSHPVNEFHIIDKQMSKVTKSTAKNNCISFTQPYNENTVTSVPSSSFNLSVSVINTGTDKYDCSLK